MRKHKSLHGAWAVLRNACVAGCLALGVMGVRADETANAGTSYLEIPKDVTLRLWGGEADGAQGAASCRSSTSGNNGSDGQPGLSGAASGEVFILGDVTVMPVGGMFNLGGGLIADKHLLIDGMGGMVGGFVIYNHPDCAHGGGGGLLVSDKKSSMAFSSRRSMACLMASRPR